jgi:radical SAM protein with 4Fe4S-binding SPASM domain
MDINGRVFYCHRFVSSMCEDLTIGDVFKGIDENRRRAVTEYWSRLRPYNAELPERCETCVFRWGCMGGCLGVNWDVCGDIHKVPKSYCDIMEINVKRLLPYVLILRSQGKLTRPQWVNW